MKLKFILASMLLAGSAFTGFADGYLDGVEYYQAGQEDNAEIVLNETLNDAQTDKAVAHYYLGSIALHKGLQFLKILRGPKASYGILSFKFN